MTPSPRARHRSLALPLSALLCAVALLGPALAVPMSLRAQTGESVLYYNLLDMVAIDSDRPDERIGVADVGQGTGDDDAVETGQHAADSVTMAIDESVHGAPLYTGTAWSPASTECRLDTSLLPLG